MSWYQNQLENRNYLSPGGFKFILDRSPKVSFLCKTANIPDINLGVYERSTPFLRVPYEGNLQFGTLEIQYLVDENLENYLEIHNWMRGLGVPEAGADRTEFRKKYEIPSLEGTSYDYLTTDATLEVLTNNFNPAFDVIFKDLFPVSLSTLNFDVSVGDVEPFTATATFRYTLFEIRKFNKNTRIK